ncbi:hypothetical protein Bca4012_046426 [Brassica carinata]
MSILTALPLKKLSPYKNNWSSSEMFVFMEATHIFRRETRSMLLANLSVTSAGGQYQTTKHKYKIIADNVLF